MTADLRLEVFRLSFEALDALVEAGNFVFQVGDFHGEFTLQDLDLVNLAINLLQAVKLAHFFFDRFFGGLGHTSGGSLTG